LAWLLLAAALTLVLLGQFYFFYRQSYLWDGLVFHALAVLCFLLAWRLSRPPVPADQGRRLFRPGVWLAGHPTQAALLGLGLFFSLAATLLSLGRGLDQATGDVVLLWTLGVSAVGLAALWPPRLQGNWRDRLRSVGRDAWLEAATVAALTMLALVLRVAALDSVPYTLGGDEAWHGLLARQVLTGQLRNPFGMGYMSMPTFFYWPISWSLWLVGDNMTGLRLPAALVGTVTVPILYLFARDLWGRRTALLSALFLAAYDYHVHYSRLGANNVWDPLFVLVVLWAVERGLSNAEGAKRTRSFLLAGVVMGLSVYFYTGARLLPPLVAAYVGFVWLRVRAGRMPGATTRNLGRNLVLLALALLITAAPMLSYAVAHPAEWNARLNQVGIIQSGWLAREPGLTDKTTAYILAEQFLRAAGAFHVYPDRTVWYGANRPLLGLLAGALAVLGMAWAVAHWRERRYFLVLLWFWSVIVSGGMLTESPPSSQRLVIAIPAVVLLVTFGLEQTARLVCRILVFDRRWERVFLGVLVAILAVSSVHYYFVRFTPLRRYGSQNGETATMMGHYLRQLEGDYQVYLLGAPRIYWSFGTMAFLASGVSGQDLIEPLQTQPSTDLVDQGRGAVFLLLAERAGEVSLLQEAFPGGHLEEFFDSGGALRFVAFQVPAAGRP
jgi:4-amino-4-deoxy-L-arabinose transferase-like glycosyltransferase